MSAKDKQLWAIAKRLHRIGHDEICKSVRQCKASDGWKRLSEPARNGWFAIAHYVSKLKL